MLASLLRKYMKLKFAQVILKLFAGKKGKLLSRGGFPIAIATFLLEELFNKAWKDKPKDKSKINKAK